MTETPALDNLSRIVIRGLANGQAVEIDGLGTFIPHGAGFRFEPQQLPRVFIAYAHEDQSRSERLFDAFATAGFAPWMDVRKLLPGQNWPRAIENAIETSDFFIACFSGNSVNKRGGFQSEIRYALDCARRMPLDQIFIMPVRLDDCRVPRTIQREFQYVDLFPDWDAGLRRILDTMRKEVQRRSKRAA